MQRIGSRAQVMHGNAKMTGGGLMKKDLKYNNSGKIVSRRMSRIAKKEMRLQKAGYITTKGVFQLFQKQMGGDGTSSDDESKGNELLQQQTNTMGMMASFLDPKNKSALIVTSKNMSERSNNIFYKSLIHINEITFNKQSTNLVLKSNKKLPNNIKNVIIDNIC